MMKGGKEGISWPSCGNGQGQRCVGVATQIATQLFATRWQNSGIATFIVATKKEPQAGYALGVLVD